MSRRELIPARRTCAPLPNGKKGMAQLHIPIDRLVGCLSVQQKLHYPRKYIYLLTATAANRDRTTGELGQPLVLKEHHILVDRMSPQMLRSAA
jgi:hypothetical protein